MPEVRRILTVVWVIGFGLAGCSGEGSGPGAQALEDLFEIGTPVRISDSIAWALTKQVTEEDAARLGQQLGYIPLTLLREPAEAVDPDFPGGSAITTVSGERLADDILPVPRIILETPYWTSIFRRIGARGRMGAFVATNLLYRVYRYGGDGRKMDSIWAPPPSWKQAREPEMGEFLPGQTEDLTQYLDSFTVIKALAVVADSIVVVSVGHYGETGAVNVAEAAELIQVYAGNRPLGLDLQAPGQLVAYSRGSLFFLNRSGEPDGTTLTEYSWRGGLRPNRPVAF